MEINENRKKERKRKKNNEKEEEKKLWVPINLCYITEETFKTQWLVSVEMFSVGEVKPTPSRSAKTHAGHGGCVSVDEDVTGKENRITNVAWKKKTIKNVVWRDKEKKNKNVTRKNRSKEHRMKKGKNE